MQFLSVPFYLNCQQLFKTHLLLSVQTMNLSITAHLNILLAFTCPPISDGNFPLSCFKWLPNYVSQEMKLMNLVGKNYAFFVQLLM